MVTRKPNIVGRSFPRVEAEPKVSGLSGYVDDIDFGPDTLYACLVTSTEPHARILSIDDSAALALPGVMAVVTGRDRNAPMGLFFKDRTLLATDRVLYVGQPVAVAIADSQELARSAARKVRIEYEVLPATSDAMASLGPKAPLVHPEMASYMGMEYINPTPDSNMSDHVQLQWGDLETGWAEADTIIEHTYQVGRLYHASMEPHAAAARMDADGRITLWASIQRPYIQLRIINETLGLEPNQLRVIAPYVGGGFGGKVYPLIEAIAVAVAMAFQGRHIKLILNRRDEFGSGFMRPGLHAHLKMGANKEGVITGLEVAYYWNVGASVDAAIKVIRGAALAGAGPYLVPSCVVNSYGVYTHQPPASPMRGNGMAELHFAFEQHVDRMADALGIDRLAFRLKNLLKGGDVLLEGRAMHAIGLDTCVREAAQAISWAEPKASSGNIRRVRGKGLAAMWNPVVIMPLPGASASVLLDAEHGCTVSIGGVESGQGVNTLAVQLVSFQLGVPQDWVRLAQVDTDHAAIDWEYTSGHLTLSIGNAVVQAVKDVRQQVLSYVAQALEEPVANLDIIEGNIVSYRKGSNLSLSLLDLLSSGLEASADRSVQISFEGRGHYQPRDRSETGTDALGMIIPPIIHFSTGAQAVEVEIDTETGAVQVLHMVPAFDVGHALNPDIVRAQMKGGAVQGLSMALLEKIRFDNGVPQNGTFFDYRIATIKDSPRRIDPIIVEVPQDDGPFGARGIGEHVMISAAPAIASAISDALGIYLDELPITAEQIWMAVMKKAELV